MKTYYNILKSILFVTILYSCTEDIELKLKGHGTRMLVVEGQITSDTTAHWIKLSYTADYFNTEEESVENAVVSISDGTNIFALTESPTTPGLFFTAPDIYGIPGLTYTLTISGIDTDEDGETEVYHAESTMPSAVYMDKIALSIEHIFFTDVLRISFDAQEPGEERNAYLFKVSYNGVMVTDTVYEWGYAHDEWYNGFAIVDEPVFYLDQKEEQYVINNGDIVTVEFSNIPVDYCYFLSEVVQEYYGSSPFSGNPANVRTNISGPRKAWGFFSAYHTHRLAARFEE